MGIGATRLIASRNRKYSYKDGTRLMTEEDQIRIFAEIDKSKIWAITVLKDEYGNEAPGYGNWPRDKEPYGADKGNTKANMAMIRSERQAFDRLCPGEMPQGVDVIDAEYIASDEGQYNVVDVKTGKIQGGKATQDPVNPTVEDDHPWLLQCPVHHVAWRRDKFQKFCHPTDEKNDKDKTIFCKIHNALWPQLVAPAKDAGFDEKFEVDDWLKNRFDGRTWSQLNEHELIVAIREMTDEAIGQPSPEQSEMETGE